MLFMSTHLTIPPKDGSGAQRRRVGSRGPRAAAEPRGGLGGSLSRAGHPQSPRLVVFGREGAGDRHMECCFLTTQHSC